MEHGPFDPQRLREFMQGLVDGGPTKSDPRHEHRAHQQGPSVHEAADAVLAIARFLSRRSTP
jgi:hypothetical protein